MKGAIKRHWFEIVGTTVFLTVVICVVSFLFGYTHRTNDDVLLRSIVSGNYTGSPDAHLIYMLYPLGLLLKGFYTIAGTVSWYDLFVVALHYFCWWLIVVRIAAVFERRRHKAAAVVSGFCLLLILDLSYVVMNQYTILAGVCGATAVLWMVLLDASKKEGLWMELSVIVLLMTFALWIRKEVFFMALPIGGCILLYQWICHFREPDFKTRWLKMQGILVGLVLGIGGLSLLADSMAYRDSRWQYFKQYNEARTEIFDYYGLAPYRSFQEKYREEGIEAADYEVLNSMSLALLPSLDAGQMSRLAEMAKAHREEQEQYYNVYRKTMYSVCDELFAGGVQPVGMALTVACAALLTALFIGRRGAGMAGVLAALAYEAVFTGYFLWRNRFPERVSFGLFFMLLLFFTGLFLKEFCPPGEKTEKAEKTAQWQNWLLLAGIVFVLGNVGIYRYRQVSDELQESRQGMEQWHRIENYAMEHSDSVYLVKSNIAGLWGDEMSLKNQSEPQNILLLGTWGYASPLYRLRSENLGLDGIGQAVVEKDKVYVIQLKKEGTEWLTDYYAGQGYADRAVVIDVINTQTEAVSVISMEEHFDEG